MNVIYSTVSDSILQYLKLQGQLADKPYLILRIHYYNILGTLDSIDILKELKVGEKVVSTTIRKTKIMSSNGQPKKTKKQLVDKDVDISTRHTKLGLMTPTQWTKLNNDYQKLIHSKILIMDKYCTSYMRLTGTTPFFAMGDKPANMATPPSKRIPLDVSSGFLLHAGCDFISTGQIAAKKNKGLKITSPFSNVYQIFPHSKSVLRITDCKSLDEFYSHFGNSAKSGIKWDSVISKYDGILVENINCGELSRKPNYKKLLLDILGKKADENQIKNIKMHLAMKELNSMGYIWRIGKNKFVKVV